MESDNVLPVQGVQGVQGVRLSWDVATLWTPASAARAPAPGLATSRYQGGHHDTTHHTAHGTHHTSHMIPGL